MNRDFCNKCKSKKTSQQSSQCKINCCESLDISSHNTENKRNQNRDFVSKYQTVSHLNSNSQTKNSQKLQSPSQRNTRIALFWDLHNNKLDSNALDETAKKLTARFQNSIKIKVYGNRYSSLFTQLKPVDYEFRMETGKSEISLLISDILSSKSLSKILIISSRFQTFKSEIMSLKFNNIKILASPTDLYEKSIDDISFNTENSKSENSSKDSASPRNEIESALLANIIKFLKDLAYQGKIVHELNELKRKLAFHLRLPVNYIQELIKSCFEAGKISQKTKKIGKFELSLLSLKTQTLTPKILLWVLRSLKLDEMISTEKAIQSRLKEAFEMKIDSDILSRFIESCIDQSGNTKNNSEFFSLFSNQNKENRKNFSFCKKSVKNFGSNTENPVIYPVNEEWISYDQYSKSGDVFHLKNTIEWKAFLDFFHKFYSGGYTEEKALSGGRYGCALYLKNFCDGLKSSSVGKLNYIIQLAIDEDILRYHKSLLVLASDFDKKCKEDKRALLYLKKTLVQLILDSDGGVSLAQIPSLLENKNISEKFISNLGYAKVKDLVDDTPDIELTLIGRNHPFVRLRELQKAGFDDLLEFVLKELEASNGTVTADDLEIKVSERFGYGFVWKSIDVKSFEDFLQGCGDVFYYDQKVVYKKNKNIYSYACSTNSDETNQLNDIDLFDNGEIIEDEIQLRFLEDLLEVR